MPNPIYGYGDACILDVNAMFHTVILAYFLWMRYTCTNTGTWCRSPAHMH